MPAITLPKGTTWKQARQKAGYIIAENPCINSVRILVEKETHQMRVEYTEFPQKVIDKLIKI